MTGGAVWHPSPNFGPRRGNAAPELIVLHYTAMASAEAARDRLCDPGFEVSAHYLIGRDGTLWHLVADEMRAWHAGAGAWRGQGDVNSRSIGIEIDNDGASPFAAPAMDRLEHLLTDVMARHRIGAAAVIGHSDMAPGRKADPGPRFDWRRLARSGLAVWPDVPDAPGFPDAQVAPDFPDAQVAPTTADRRAFDAALTAIGYPDAAPEDRLAVFRARFRPHGKGPLDATDTGLARALARLRDVDVAQAEP